jgi:hypothetical protein
VTAVEIILLVVVLVVALLIVGGLAVNSRRYRQDERTLGDAVLTADQALATAHAADKGWDRPQLETAARDAFTARSKQPIRELHLVQVVDRPGTEEDEALFRVVTDGGEHDVRLGRRDDGWAPLG